MFIRPRTHSSTPVTAGLTMLVAALLLGVFSASAFGAPTNVSVPAISPAAPHVDKPATATTGAWKSENSAHWFACSEQGGGKYADGKCGVEGPPNAWESTQLAEGATVGVTATGTPIVLAAIIGGLKTTVTCDTTVTSTSLSNPTGGGAGQGEATVEYKNCKLTEAGGSTCTVTPESAVGANLALGKVDGSAKIVITPKGANLGVFVWAGAKCPAALKGTRPLYGAIHGFFGNAGSQIEFNAASSGGGQLRWSNAIEGPKVSATGTVGLKASGGGNIKADALSYAYEWQRCSAECATIGGATSATYVPVALDQGKSLRVVVTATDTTGSTAANSSKSGLVTASLSWYECGEWGGSGVYEDPNCQAAGGSKAYSWMRAASTPFTSANNWGGLEKAPYQLNWSWSGLAFDIDCNDGSGTGVLASGENQASIENYDLTLSNCSMSKPAACELVGTTITFNTLKASSPTGSVSEIKPTLLFEPATGSELVHFDVTNCAIPGTYRFYGSIPAVVDNETSTIVTTYADVIGAGTMRFKEASGPKVGLGSVNRPLSEGERPVKLDIAP